MSAKPPTVRPCVREACDVLDGLSVLYREGVIGGDQWLANVVGVLARVQAGHSPTAEDRAALTAATRPRVADPTNKGAAENVRRLPDRDPVNSPSVKGHAA